MNPSEQFFVTCPFCWEVVPIVIEADVEGSFVQDCEVCCHPWQLTLRRGHDGTASLDVERG